MSVEEPFTSISVSQFLLVAYSLEIMSFNPNTFVKKKRKFYGDPKVTNGNIFEEQFTFSEICRLLF
jgi:hypothetical protein